jgi:hypothetical protein
MDPCTPVHRGSGGVFKLTNDKQVAASRVKLTIYPPKVDLIPFGLPISRPREVRK